MGAVSFYNLLYVEWMITYWKGMGSATEDVGISEHHVANIVSIGLIDGGDVGWRYVVRERRSF